MNYRKWLRRGAGLVVWGVLAGATAQEARHSQPGPAVGGRLPEFTATDQNGVRRTLDSLKGPNGLVLTIVRSADW